MADPNFYDSRGPFSIAEIERLAQSRLAEPNEGKERLIHDVAPLSAAGPGLLSYCERPKYAGLLKQTRASAVFVTQALAKEVPIEAVALVSAQPQLAFCKIAQALYPSAGLLWDPENPPLSSIAPSARIGLGAVVAPGAYIGAGVEIGESTLIGPNAVIGRGVKIGTHCRIGANVTIAYTLIGDRVSIMAGTQIGQDGFGYAPSPAGLSKVPQLGRVIIQDHVEIGANCAIDRGALTDTVIGEGTKLDNLVQIAHNVVLGRFCVIAAQCGISGSAKLGDFVMMGGQVGVADHVTIGEKSQIAGRSGVTRGLAGGQAYGGFPARPVREWRREVAALARLAKRKHEPHDDGAD